MDILKNSKLTSKEKEQLKGLPEDEKRYCDSLSEFEQQQYVKMLRFPQSVWDRLGSVGVSRRVLMEIDKADELKNKVVSEFCRGCYTPLLPLSLKADGDGSPCLDARLEASVRVYYSRDALDGFMVTFETPVVECSLRDVYYIDTQAEDLPEQAARRAEAEKNLRETGHCQMPIPVKIDGKVEMCLCSKNAYTNRPVVMPVRRINFELFVKRDDKGRIVKEDGKYVMTNTINGAQLTEAEKKAYLAGEYVLARGLQRRDGTRFDSYIQFDVFQMRNTFPGYLKQSEAQTHSNSLSEGEALTQEQSRVQSRGHKI